MLKKSLTLGVICLLMLITIPIFSGEIIEYPKEEGPYTVFIGGKCNGGGIPNPIHFDVAHFITRGNIRYIQVGPLSYFVWPWGPEYHMEEESRFIVNYKLQHVEYPVSIFLYGFKGYAPALGLWFTKTFINGRIRVFGVCEEISLWYPSN
jgi:hypothetical protein